MASKDFYCDEKRIYEYNDNYIVRDPLLDGFRLKKVDLVGNYNRQVGRYRASGTIVFPNFRADRITELFSFEHDVVGSGSVDYQISNDNGITFYYVSSSGTWSVASSGTYSPLGDVDEALDAFPVLHPKQLRLKARIQPNEDRTASPCLKAVSIGFEHDAIFEEDLKKSFSRHIIQRLMVTYESKLEVASGTTSYSLPVTPSGTFHDVQSVYNILDSNRQTNLFGYHQSGVVDLSIIQPSGVLVVKHRGGIPIFIGADLDINIAIKPSIAIKENNEVELKAMRNGEDVVSSSISRMEARVRPHPEYREMDLTLFCQHGSEKAADQIKSALTTLLQSKPYFDSHDSGQRFHIRVLDPNRDTDYTIHSNAVGVKIYGYFDLNRQTPFENESGVALIEDREFVGSGVEDKFDSVPLIVENGVRINLVSLHS